MDIITWGLIILVGIVVGLFLLLAILALLAWIPIIIITIKEAWQELLGYR